MNYFKYRHFTMLILEKIQLFFAIQKKYFGFVRKLNGFQKALK